MSFLRVNKYEFRLKYEFFISLLKCVFHTRFTTKVAIKIIIMYFKQFSQRLVLLENGYLSNNFENFHHPLE